MLNRLSTSGVLRKQAVAAAQNVAGQEKPNLDEVADDLKAADLFGETLSAPKPFQPWNLVGSPGVLLTWVMVSMGAPFWLSQLSKLLGLRSEMARKAAEQRTLRDKDLRPGSASPR